MDCSQASLSITNSQSLFKLMSIESVMPSNCLILCLSPPAFDLPQHQGLFQWLSSMFYKTQSKMLISCLLVPYLALWPQELSPIAQSLLYRSPPPPSDIRNRHLHKTPCNWAVHCFDGRCLWLSLHLLSPFKEVAVMPTQQPHAQACPPGLPPLLSRPHRIIS